jgi:phage antirepressor YoqD-like protein
MITFLQKYKEEQQKRIEAENQIEAQKPKVVFADAVSISKTSILIGDLAKLIKQNGYEIGQKRLFKWLRENGYLMQYGESYNMPTQKSMQLGLFEVKEGTVINPDDSVRITKTTKVTGKGQIYFINKFVEKSA